MKAFKSVLFSMVMASSAMAADLMPQSIRSSGLGLTPEVVSRIEQTVLKMQMDENVTNAFCSVFPVTPDGYMLTALHCVRGCLAELGKVDQASNAYLGLTDLTVVHRPESVNSVCPKFSIGALGIKGNVKVVATGSALTLYDSSFLMSSSGLFEELRSRGWEQKANDFALLKIETETSLRCLRLNPTRVSNGMDLYSVGYPVSNKKDGEPLLSASRGQMFAGVEQSETFKSQTNEDARQMVRMQYGAKNLIFSNAWNTYGQSGGPIIARDGSVIGITSGFATPTGGNPKNVHELVGSTIANVLKSLPKETARMIYQKNSGCN